MSSETTRLFESETYRILNEITAVPQWCQHHQADNLRQKKR